MFYLLKVLQRLSTSEAVVNYFKKQIEEAGKVIKKHGKGSKKSYEMSFSRKVAGKEVRKGG